MAPPLMRDRCYEFVLPESLPGPSLGTAIRLRSGDGQPINPHDGPSHQLTKESTKCKLPLQRFV